jgi:hypothetical protein
LRLNSRNILPPQRKQKVLDVDEAAAQEEWDAIPDEAPSGAPALSPSQHPSTISYDEAVAALTAVDMSAAVPRVVLYEAPASCFGRLMQCFSRPSLHIQNAEEELQLPFLLALTPFDGYHPLFAALYPSSSLVCRLNPTHLSIITTFYSKITSESRPVDRVGR